MKKLQQSLIYTSASLVMLLQNTPIATSEEFQQVPITTSEEFQQVPNNTPITTFNLTPAASLLAQATEPSINQTPNVLVPNPEIIIKSNGSQNDPILTQGTVDVPVSPNLPRAVAPPVGDIAVSNISAASEQVDLGTRAIVPRLVLRQAPAKEVLAVLARYAGLNLVFTDVSGGEATPGTPQAQ